MNANERAFQFWHEHAGSKMGKASMMESLTCGYPTTKKDGEYNLRRMGSVGGFILMDANQVVINDALIPCHLPNGLPATASHIQITNLDTTYYSINRSVLNWMIDPCRSFPFLAIELSKGTNAIRANLRLTESPHAAQLISKDATLKFDIFEVREALHRVNQCENNQDWIKATKAKCAMESAPQDLEKMEYLRNIKNMVTAFAKIQPIADMSLPIPGTDMFEVLKRLTASKLAMDFSVKK